MRLAQRTPAASAPRNSGTLLTSGSSTAQRSRARHSAARRCTAQHGRGKKPVTITLRRWPLGDLDRRSAP